MYPVMVNIVNQKVVIIGGGNVVARKVKKLIEEKADITIVSPTLHEEIDQSKITWIKDVYQSKYLVNAKLVFACTNNQAVNDQVKNDAHPSQLVNNTGDKYNSDFYNVSIVTKNDFSVNISTNGVSPARAKEIRRKLEALLDTI